MALQIVEAAALSHVGRQREANEDAYVAQAPFFAVADGMGGAKAGEVASRLATEAFLSPDEAGEAPEARLERIAREANRRIFDQAASDESLRGMGTTLTAALVHGREVSLGHVGDSRAYLLRDGELEQLTRDHSLVAELERRGQLTREAAEHHPQRSIITRALGPEPDVEVDTYTIAGRPGDLFLLCSDGLTGMVADAEVATILRQAKSLEEAAQTLIEAANTGGGKDNITAVLFRLGEDGAGGEEEDTAAAEETVAGQLHADEVQAAAAAHQPQPATQEAPPAEAAAAAPAPPRPRPPARPPPRPAQRRRSARRALKVSVALVVVAAVGAGLYALDRQVYFVGTDDSGLVTLYRGIPYDLPLGIKLYSEQYRSGVPVGAIPAGRRKTVLDHEWRGRGDAVDLVRTLERGGLEGTRR